MTGEELQQLYSNLHQREVQLKKTLDDLAAEKALREQAQRETAEAFRVADINYKHARTYELKASEAQRERDEAIREANRRDQKWMDGINEIVGRKLDYGDPSSANAASTALGAIVRERDEAQKELARHKDQLEHWIEKAEVLLQAM